MPDDPTQPPQLTKRQWDAALTCRAEGWSCQGQRAHRFDGHCPARTREAPRAHPPLRTLRKAARVPQGAYFVASSATTVALITSGHLDTHLTWPLVAVNATIALTDAVRMCCRTYLLTHTPARTTTNTRTEPTTRTA